MTTNLDKYTESIMKDSDESDSDENVIRIDRFSVQMNRTVKKKIRLSKIRVCRKRF